MIVDTVEQDSGLYVCHVISQVLDKSVHSGPLQLEVLGECYTAGANSVLEPALGRCRSTSPQGATSTVFFVLERLTAGPCTANRARGVLERFLELRNLLPFPSAETILLLIQTSTFSAAQI